MALMHTSALQQAASTSAPTTTSDLATIATIVACRQRITRLRNQAQVIDDDVASMRHTACQMGEASDWQDTRLPALDETITFWVNRYRAVLAQITSERARLITLLSGAAVTGQATPFGWDTRPRGAQAIVREAL